MKNAYYTEKTAAAVVARMLKSKANKNRPALQYTWIDANNKQCSCDGFRAYRFAAPVPGLPDIPDGLTPIDLDKVFPDDSKLTEIDAPALADVLALQADDKKHARRKRGQTIHDDGDTRRGLYFFGQGLPVVNLDYLADMLRVFPSARWYYTGSNVGPLVIKADEGDGLLLPVRYTDKTCENKGAAYDPRPIPAAQAPEKADEPAYTLAQFAARFAAA